MILKWIRFVRKFRKQYFLEDKNSHISNTYTGLSIMRDISWS